MENNYAERIEALSAEVLELRLEITKLKQMLHRAIDDASSHCMADAYSRMDAERSRV